MESQQSPLYEQPRASYGSYEGTTGYSSQQSQQQYESSYQHIPSEGPINNDIADAIAARVADRINQQNAGKLLGQPYRAEGLSQGQKTAVAIVSVSVLLPMAIVLGEKGFGGIVALGIACLAIFFINASVNNIFKS